MIRWHAELYIEKSRTPDAIYTSPSKTQALGGVFNYVFTMVNANESFKIVVKPVTIKENV